MIRNDLRKRLAGIEGRLGRKVKVAHLVTARTSLSLLLERRLQILREYGFENTGLSGDVDWFAGGESEAYRFIPVKNLTRKMEPWSDARALVHLVTILREGQHEIVNTYGPKPGAFGRIAARVAGVPLVVHTNWGLLATERSSFLKKAFVLGVEAVVAQFGDRVMSVNRDDMIALRRLQVRGGFYGVSYLGNACDLNHFDPRLVCVEKVTTMRERWGVSRDALIVGMVGRLVKEKGAVEFIEAARWLGPRHPECAFVVVGPVDPYKKDRVDPEMAEQWVRLVGFESDMRTAYAAMDIVVLPSHREGFPRTLVEASAMCKPIVTTDSRGCREAVDPGESGLLVPVGDSRALSEAIRRFLVDAELRLRAGNKSREKAHREFDEHKLVARMVEVYLEGLESKLFKSFPRSKGP